MQVRRSCLQDWGDDAAELIETPLSVTCHITASLIDDAVFSIHLTDITVQGAL